MSSFTFEAYAENQFTQNPTWVYSLSPPAVLWQICGSCSRRRPLKCRFCRNHDVSRPARTADLSVQKICPLSFPVNSGDQWAKWNMQHLPHKSDSLALKELHGWTDEQYSKSGGWLVFLGHVKDPVQPEEASGPAKELERIFRLYGGRYRIFRSPALVEICSLRGVS